MVILSLFWRGYTATGAITSMIVGFVSIPLFKFVVQNIEGIGVYFTALEALPPAFIASFVAGFVVSKYKPDLQSSKNYATSTIKDP
jgi:sodium/proline symporter